MDKTFEIEHLHSQWIPYHMQWAESFEELMRIHHHSALALMPKAGNILKGNCPIGEFMQIIVDGNFERWESVGHSSDTVHLVETVVIHENVLFFEEAIANGGAKYLILEGAVRVFNMKNKTNKYRFNNNTGVVEEIISTSVNNPRIEDQAQLQQFESRLSPYSIQEKTWNIDETGFCLSNPQEKQSSYILRDRSYVIDEAGETCSYFSSITMSTEFIDSPGEHDFVISTKSGAG